MRLHPCIHLDVPFGKQWGEHGHNGESNQGNDFRAALPTGVDREYPFGSSHVRQTIGPTDQEVYVAERIEQDRSTFLGPNPRIANLYVISSPAPPIPGDQSFEWHDRKPNEGHERGTF